jgi:hypothetical protein
MAFDYGIQPTGPSAISPVSKPLRVKSVRLLPVDFTTGGVNSVKVVLPAQVAIQSIQVRKQTQFTGGGITAATLSIGIPGTPTRFVTAADVFASAAGFQGFLPALNLHQTNNLPLGADIQLLFTGTAVTGNPTAGELYVDIVYVD